MTDVRAKHASIAASGAEFNSRSAARREATGIEVGLNAAIVAVLDDEPVVLTVRPEGDSKSVFEGLPTGPFSPLQHRTLESGLRTWVLAQTGVNLGYAEQLYTFADRSRIAQTTDASPHLMSIGYLALAHANGALLQRGAWKSWYEFFPWEDWRRGRPEIIGREIEPRLKDWISRPPISELEEHPLAREERIRISFGIGGPWDEEKVLDRYELLYEAGLVEEARRDGREASLAWGPLPRLGQPMRNDHRRILATAIGRVRGKIKYRPVIFELMGDEFTLFELQKTVEAILGPHLHKQNFRRLVESAGLVEPTGEVKNRTGGRPAKLFRFRRVVLTERPSPGVRVKLGRA